MMGKIQVRRAEADDAEAVAGLLDQLGYPTVGAEVPARLERMRADGRVEVFLAQRGEEVVGLATAHVLSVLNRGRDVAWLTALVVDESARGTGVGRGLVGAVEEFARRAGCERLSVTTQEHRTDAHAFYTRLGFQQTGRRFGKVLAP